MRRSHCLLVGTYGAAMMALATVLAFRPSFHDSAKVLGSTGACFATAALGLYFAKQDESTPSRLWMFALVIVAIAQWVALWFHAPSEFRSDFSEASPALWYLIPFLFAAFAFSRLRPGHFHGPSRRWLAVLLPGAMLTGAVLILFTLAFTTTEHGAGWQIITLRDHWITYDYNLSAFLPDTPLAHSLRTLFAVAGCAAYLLALALAITAAAAVVMHLASLPRLARSRWTQWIGAAGCLTTFWLYNDIYWGWQAVLLDADEANALWPATTCLLLEFAAGAGVLPIVIAELRQKGMGYGLWMVQVAQVPLAVLNFILMPELEGGLIDLPGLVLLMMGLQLLTWAGLGILLAGPVHHAAESVSGRKAAAALA